MVVLLEDRRKSDATGIERLCTVEVWRRKPCFIINSVYLLLLSEHELGFFIELSIEPCMAF